jgi:hypothetical protein
MRSISRESQTGQAMTEFVVAMIAMVPLLLGVMYLYRYNDVKHQTIQASRYAALAQNLDPQYAGIGDETRARFFRDDAQHPIGHDDKATGSPALDENPNWMENDGEALLGSSYADIKVSSSDAGISSGKIAVVEGAAPPEFKLNDNFGEKTEVEVPLSNVASFAPLASINIKIGATTVMAGDAWSGGGSDEINSAMTVGAVPAKTLKWFDNSVFNTLFKLFTDSPAPKFGEVDTDVVPKSDTQ